MYTLTNGKFKVKCIRDNKYGFVVGDFYDAYDIKSALVNKNNIISVVNAYGEEYAYPAGIFEIVKAKNEHKNH